MTPDRVTETLKRVEPALKRELQQAEYGKVGIEFNVQDGRVLHVKVTKEMAVDLEVKP